MDEFNDIEEVESVPKKRIRFRNNHSHNTHHHNHEQNNQNNNQHNGQNNNIDNNRNNNKYIRRRKRVLFIKKFGFFEKLLILAVLLSSFVIFLSFLINIILTLKGVITPRIFLPSIIIFITSFMFSGGILGTYVPPPPGHHAHFRRSDIFMIRTLAPIVMLALSIIFLFFSLNNIRLLKANIKRAQIICESNPGLSMDQIYNKTSETNYKLEELKYDLIYLFNQNLVCFPKGKCIKIINEENNYICNTDEFIKNNNITDVSCLKINNNDINNEYMTSINNNKNTKLFFENCNELTKNSLSHIEMFKCNSKKNLEKIKYIPNWNEHDKNNIEDYFNNKLDQSMIDIEKNKQMMYIYENSNYDYDLECYNSFDYKLTYFIIKSYYFAYYIISFDWIILGLISLYNFMKFVKNNEMNINVTELRDINGVSNDEDSNRLMEVQNINKNEKYVELSNYSE